MSYEERSFKEIIEMIGRNEIYLPAIQRKFVWKHEQIESFFDSIMRDYPIGTFLFWFIGGEKKNEYTFYKFLKDYHERDKCINDIAPKPELKDEIIGVLDGQQRLSSLYVALQGTYAYKKQYLAWFKDSAFPKREFYINLFRPIEKIDGEEFIYEFKFLTPSEAHKIDNEHLWFNVKEIITWGNDPEVDIYYEKLEESNEVDTNICSLIRSKREQIKKIIRILHQRLVIEKLVSYYKIEEPDLDNVLDIFIRVNSGGTYLSKSDLLFSTIVANWEAGREEIEVLLQIINKKGNSFKFDNDFIMRSCLVLTDCPVLFKVNSFKKENINKVKNSWEKIKDSLEKLVDLLVEFGFSGETLVSQNAVIPVAYYIFKDGIINHQNKRSIRSYIIRVLIKQIFGGQGDQILSNIRDILRAKIGEDYRLIDKNFSLNELLSSKISSTRNLIIEESDIDGILDLKKGLYSFMVLSLLYPNLKFDRVSFHQDHIHPASLFTPAKLRFYKIPEEKWKMWQENKDKLPNLQLMEGLENETKNKTPFEDWLDKFSGLKNENTKEIFKKENYIPSNMDLNLSNFENFFNARKEILKEKIKDFFISST